MSESTVAYYAALNGVTSGATAAPAAPAAAAAAAPSASHKPAAAAPAKEKKPAAAAGAGAAERKAMKAARLAAQTQSATSSRRVEVCDPDKDAFGVHPTIRSLSRSDRVWTAVKDLNETLAGKFVWLRARFYSSRGQGKSCFVVLREGFATVQLAAFLDAHGVTKANIKFMSQVSRESIVDVYAEVCKVDQPIKSCSQKDVELKPVRFYVVSASEALPFNVEDAARRDDAARQAEAEGRDLESEPAASAVSADAVAQIVRVKQDLRLDNRWIDLRSACGMLFREYLLNNDFVEIHTPKLIGTASEGGANVFRVGYFGRDAFLAQSPQLYKQMAVCGDLPRVFEIGPVFRAENSNTHRHLCEFVGLDIEMAFHEHYHEVLDVISAMLRHIFAGLEQRFSRELAAVNEQFPFEPLVFERDRTLRIPYSEGIALLNANGENLSVTDDIDTKQEKKLGRIVKEKYGTDFFIMDKFPSAIRPFYSMPDPVDERFCNSYDIYVRGEEISSGAQRVHEPAMLIERCKFFGIPPEQLQSYIDGFRHGAPPHAGCGIGLERLVFLYLGLPNVRRSSMFPRDPKRLFP